MVSLAMTTRQARRPFSGDGERWEALVRRDRSADGAFYYSVRTTGVYCRPSCAARPARRENVAIPCNLRRRRARRLPSLQALPAEPRLRSPNSRPRRWSKPAG